LQPYHDITEPAVAKVLAHPLRSRILAALEGRSASPTALADELDAPIGVVAYHVRRLHKLGFLELVDRVQRRGAIEHLYAARSRPLISDDSWASLPTVVKEATINSALRQIGSYVTAAAAVGGFDDPETHLTRSPVTVDEQGWHELARRLEALTEEVRQIEADSRQRLARTDHHREQEATVVMMLFHSPPAGGPAIVTGGHRAEEPVSAATSAGYGGPNGGSGPRIEREARQGRAGAQPGESGSPFVAQTLAAHRAYWQDGLTLREVAPLLGVTAERVRQRFRAAGLPTRSPAEARRIRLRLRPLESSSRERRARAALEDAFAEHGNRSFSRTAYEMMRRRNHREWPTSETVIKALGGDGWAGALAAVGLDKAERVDAVARASRWPRIRELSARGLTASEIAAKLGPDSGASEGEISRAVRRARICELWAGGLTASQIADDLGLNTGVVNAEIARMRDDGEDLPLRRPGKRRNGGDPEH
jgi:DNA-binding transcriptional ArsR family regulator